MSTRSRPDTGGALVAVLLIAVGGLALWDSRAYVDPDSAVFPRIVAIAMIAALVIYLMGWLLGRGKRVVTKGRGSWVRRALLVGTMLAGALAMSHMGFLLAAIPVFGALVMVAMHDTWTPARMAVYPLIGLSVIIGFYYLFQELLLVPLPSGKLF